MEYLGGITYYEKLHCAGVNLIEIPWIPRIWQQQRERNCWCKIITARRTLKSLLLARDSRKVGDPWPITLHFVRSRWHLLHAFQFAYSVISAITFFIQSSRGAVIGKFCSYLAC